MRSLGGAAGKANFPSLRLSSLMHFELNMAVSNNVKLGLISVSCTVAYVVCDAPAQAFT